MGTQRNIFQMSFCFDLFSFPKKFQAVLSVFPCVKAFQNVLDHSLIFSKIGSQNCVFVVFCSLLSQARAQCFRYERINIQFS